MYSVQCTVYNVSCTYLTGAEQYTLYMYDVHCTTYNVRVYVYCTMYNVTCTTLYVYKYTPTITHTLGDTYIGSTNLVLTK